MRDLQSKISSLEHTIYMKDHKIETTDDLVKDLKLKI